MGSDSPWEALHPPAWHTYLSHHLYDVADFQLKLVIVLRQVAECYLAPTPPSLACTGKGKHSDPALVSKIDFKERHPRHAGKLSWLVSNMLSGTWLEAWQLWSLGERQEKAEQCCLVFEKLLGQKGMDMRNQSGGAEGKSPPRSAGAQCCLKRFSMDRALYLLVTFNESWCDTVEGKEWSASNASEAEEILPKCAKEKIKYSGLSLTNHHPFNMLELRLISKGWLDFSLLLVPFQMPHRGSANPLRSSSLCPRGAISRIPGCLHRTNPGTSREKPGPHFAWLKDTQSHSISLPQCGPTGRSWFKAVQIRMQLSTPQTRTVGRQNMHMVCVMGLKGQRQTAEEAQAAKTWTGEGDWDQHCSEAYRSRLTTSPHSFLLPHGLEHHRDQRLQGHTFRSAYIIFGYCLQGLLSFSNLPWNSQFPQEWPLAALRPPCSVMSYRGEALATSDVLIDIYPKPVA